MTRQELRWRLEYVGFRSFACLIEILSIRQIDRIANFLAFVFTQVLPRKLTRYDVAKENLQQAFGDSMSNDEIELTIRKMWIHLFRLVAEIIQFPRKFHHENFREIVRFQDRSDNVQALLSGRPVIMVGGHFGNWEATTATFGFFGYKCGLVARELDNPYLDKWFRKARELTGHKVYLKVGGWDGMVEVMESKGALGLMCDQDAGKRGIFVNFFNRPASTFRSIALMALEHKALILVGYGLRAKDDFDHCRWSRFELGTEEIIDVCDLKTDDEVHEISQRFTCALERAIHRAPEQYFWVHRRWKSVPRVKGAAKT